MCGVGECKAAETTASVELVVMKQVEREMHVAGLAEDSERDDNEDSERDDDS